MAHRAALFALSVLVLFGTQSIAAEYPEVVFILDSSGSMADNAGGKQKMVAAKEVMHQIVPELDEQVRVGLTAYGHRRPGDCADIEVLLPAGSTDRKQLLQYVDQLQPVGRTPISAAILSVAAEIRVKDVETTIILVSDGLETCGGDPCLVTAELKKTGCKFVLHVVGFDVSAEAAAQLQCAAQAGGGRYFSADDTASLLAALRSVNAEVKQKVIKAESVLKTAGTGLGKLRVSMPQGAEKSLHAIRVLSADGEKQVAMKTKPGETYQTPLRTGEYRVLLGFAQPNHGEPTWTDLGEVTIRKGETRELNLGAVVLNLPDTLVKNKWDQRINLDTVILANAGSSDSFVVVHDRKNGYYNFLAKPVPAGIYNVLFQYRDSGSEPAVVEQNVVVEPNRDAIVTLNSAFQLRETDAEITSWRLTPTASDKTVDAAEGNAAESTPALSVKAAGSRALCIPILCRRGSMT